MHFPYANAVGFRVNIGKLSDNHLNGGLHRFVGEKRGLQVGISKHL